MLLLFKTQSRSSLLPKATLNKTIIKRFPHLNNDNGVDSKSQIILRKI